jgi:formylglycine-generating enzyme required for sulfatase activity
MNKTSVQVWDTGNQSVAVHSIPPKKKGFFSPLVLGAVALVVLLGLGGAGVGGAFMAGLIPWGKTGPTPTPAASPPETPGGSTPIPIKAEMVQIPGGTFRMGSDDGNDNEKPVHAVTVEDFEMDKTEVSNEQFYAFMTDSKYKPASADKFLAHWENDKPIEGAELLPVRWVSLEDAKAFAAWRSKREGSTYRLPTESEWEYAARNGSKNNIYPWGDKYDAKCAVLDGPNNDPKPVGSTPCANDWGVKDLIGNVFEWTGSAASLYPGSTGEVTPRTEPFYMVRGGGAFYKSAGPGKITSTFRQDAPATLRSPGLGFRLVRGK